MAADRTLRFQLRIRECRDQDPGEATVRTADNPDGTVATTTRTPLNVQVLVEPGTQKAAQNEKHSAHQGVVSL
jgi:hypothetical protein